MPAQSERVPIPHKEKRAKKKRWSCILIKDDLNGTKIDTLIEDTLLIRIDTRDGSLLFAINKYTPNAAQISKWMSRKRLIKSLTESMEEMHQNAEIMAMGDINAINMNSL